MNKFSGEKLLAIVDLLDKKTLLIATNWVKEETLTSVFTARKISRKKFRDSYAVPIIKYFIGVIRKEKEAGGCPVMTKFVNYMLTKNITPKEVYLICSGYRKILIRFALQQEIVLQDPLPFIDELSFLFDTNFAGVLSIFDASFLEPPKQDTISSQDKEMSSAEKDTLQETLNIINSVNTKILIVQGNEITFVNKPFLDMAGAEDLNSFYEKHSNGFDIFNDVDTYEKDFKKDVAQWTEKLCKEKKRFTTSIYHEEITKTFSYSGRITELATPNGPQYIIALSNISDHIKDESMIEDYLSHDEVTGFKNYANFEGFLTEKVEDAKESNAKLFLAVADIIDLKHINTEKGWEVGDRIVSELAEDLRFIVDDNITLARLEGSRFGILLEYETEQDAYDWCVRLHQRIKEIEAHINIAITEVDLSQSINKLFVRSYALIEDEMCKARVINNDFLHVIEYKQLDDQDEFTNALKKLKQVEASLYFMELPVTANLKIVSTDFDSADIILSAKQMEIAKVNMQIYFKLDKLNNIVANISEIDDQKRIATIDSFRKDTHSPLNRKAVRVQADDNLKVYIRHEENDYKVEVLNMNDHCIAIEIDRTRNLDVNSLVFIDVILPLSDQEKACRTDASITRINKTATGYKLVLLCHLDEKNKQVLSQYISEQQMNIIKIMRK